ncbi:hypothetical protein [Spirosoma endbachense]|uniref:hypothetical protein n=1 Tax=Spirosoma endbachense TaxID=2666025 RepID=UPI0013917CDD|nr:hypothetical protein [Spirosoma endbachense]
MNPNTHPLPGVRLAAAQDHKIGNHDSTLGSPEAAQLPTQLDRIESMLQRIIENQERPITLSIGSVTTSAAQIKAALDVGEYLGSAL